MTNDVGVSGLSDADILDEDPTAPEERCCICLDGFSRIQGVRLSRCQGHWFHRECIRRACAVKPFCPYCSVQYAPLVGNQPAGQMVVYRFPHRHVPGCEGAGLIEIRYIFPFGCQESYHPSPGVPYDGTERTAYLPCNSEGIPWNWIRVYFRTSIILVTCFWLRNV